MARESGLCKRNWHWRTDVKYQTHCEVWRLDFDSPVIVRFVDYGKALDCVIWECLWRVLSELGVPHHLISLLQSLYQKSKGLVAIEYQNRSILRKEFHKVVYFDTSFSTSTVNT